MFRLVFLHLFVDKHGRLIKLPSDLLKTFANGENLRLKLRAAFADLLVPVSTAKHRRYLVPVYVHRDVRQLAVVGKMLELPSLL